jgi:hypothetical protein
MDSFKQYPGENKYEEGLMLDEYQGVYSLVSAQQGKDGKIYKKWGYYQTGRGEDRRASDKSVPWKIKLGDNLQEAQAMLAYLYHQLKGAK